jgi:hypothetical protein
MKDFSAKFHALVKGELPKGSCIVVPRGDNGLLILATWRRPGDPFFPPSARA